MSASFLSQGVTAHHFKKRGYFNDTYLRNAIPLLLVALSAAAYALFICNKTMPISEGWYTEYAKLINEGFIPYKDFAYLFPPVYLYIIAGFTNLFGYSILALRILGVIVYASMAVVLYLIFSEVFCRAAAIPASLVSIYYMQSALCEIFYDYIYFFGLFAFLAIYCSLLAIKLHFNNRAQRAMLMSLLCGVFTGLALLVKQSTGLILLCYYPILYLGVGVCSNSLKHSLRLIGTFLAGNAIIIVPVFVLLKICGAFDAFWTSCITQAASAKGGVLTELFSWLPSSLPAIIQNAGLFAFVSMLCLYFNSMGKDNLSKSKKIDLEIILVVFMFAGIVACIFILYQWETFTRLLISYFSVYNLMFSGFLFTLSIFLFLVVKAIASWWRKFEFKEKNYLLISVSGAAFCIAWGVGMSGGFAQSQLAIPVGMLIAFPVYCLIQSNVSKKLLFVIASVAIILISDSIAVKYVQQYSWWGLTSGSIWEQQYNTDAPLLDNIKMNEETAKCYSMVNRVVRDNSNENESIFCFPHCPIFYAITDRDAQTYTRVQWFDVSSVESVESDLKLLKRNPPKVLVICKLPEDVMQGHEKAFSTFQTREMQEGLLDLAKQKYELKGDQEISSGYQVLVYVRNDTD